MYNIPEGFIATAIDEVKEAFFFDRNNGKYHPTEHYFIIEAEYIWNSYICWKNQDSARYDRSALTVKDIECGCKRYGIPCCYDRKDLLVRMENRTYIFIPSWNSCHGGPVGGEMKYLRNMFASTEEMRFSIGALFRFLRWFDNAIPKVSEQIEEAVDVFGSQFKRAQILQAGAERILEPGLEDMAYRYSFRSDDEDYLDIWIYYKNEDGTALENVIRLSFRYEEYTTNPQFIKNVVKSLAMDEENISSYTRWATEPMKKDEGFPIYSGKKNAGVCVWSERNK